jgi:hypothetical protein
LNRDTGDEFEIISNGPNSGYCSSVGILCFLFQKLNVEIVQQSYRQWHARTSHFALAKLRSQSATLLKTAKSVHQFWERLFGPKREIPKIA